MQLNIRRLRDTRHDNKWQEMKHGHRHLASTAYSHKREGGQGCLSLKVHTCTCISMHTLPAGSGWLMPKNIGRNYEFLFSSFKTQTCWAQWANGRHDTFIFSRHPSHLCSSQTQPLAGETKRGKEDPTTHGPMQFKTRVLSGSLSSSSRWVWPKCQ